MKISPGVVTEYRGDEAEAFNKQLDHKRLGSLSDSVLLFGCLDFLFGETIKPVNVNLLVNLRLWSRQGKKGPILHFALKKLIVMNVKTAIIFSSGIVQDHSCVLLNTSCTPQITTPHLMEVK